MSGWTPSQTVGPFFHFGLCFDAGSEIVNPDTPGAIVIEGSVFDGAGVPVPDALLEVWQADAEGRYRSFGAPIASATPSPTASGSGSGSADQFDGFGRVPTDVNGRYRLITIKPGAVAGPDGVPQAPHLLINVFARGLLTPQLTRLYFADDAGAHQQDAVLALVPAARRETLIARQTGELSYRWDLVLQGERETVFFDVQ
jgi:protocatechuate 3,4-dioxygenase, alpha subunit